VPPRPSTMTRMIDRLQFGRTGHASSRVIFGAAALGEVDQATADALLPVLDAHGVNHLDTAASYGDAELRLAPWLVDRRADFFLATKTGERTADDARRELERSLQRLGVDSVDLIQLHNLVEPDEWEVALGLDGAAEALFSARDEGLVGAVGVTGHGLRVARMHLASLDRFDFDSVLLPYNHSMMQIEEYRRDVDLLLARCADGRVAVQTIKSIARRRWRDPSSDSRRSWYEPIRESGALQRAVAYVLSQPGLFLNSSSDYELLADVLEAAAGPATRPDDAAMLADAAALDIEPLFDGSDLERI
jgi:aryl-alcohol dehydrogenase-like predicted oxidoreductase